MQRKNVPYTAKVWVPVLRDGAVDRELRSLIEAAGGATATRADGFWVEPEGSIIDERVRVLEVAYGDDDWKVEPAVYHLAQGLLDSGEQAVLIEINNRRVLLTP